jgi:proline iminopeptidase
LDRTVDPARIETPTFVIGARYDTTDPAQPEWMAGELPNGKYLFCADGAHVAYHDDSEVSVDGMTRFLEGMYAVDTSA